MGEIDFERRLRNGDQIRYRIKTDRGRVVDFVVQYEVILDGNLLPVVRYDGSHGQGHRDILDSRGESSDKTWLPDHMDLGNCLEYGHRDLRENWERYRTRFLERYT